MLTFDHVVLLWLLFLPLLGAIVVAALGVNQRDLIRWISLGTSVVVLVLALVLAGRFMALDRSTVAAVDPAKPQAAPTFKPEFVPGSTDEDPHATTWDWVSFGPGKIQFYLGVDGISIWLVVLTAVLFLPSVLISWTHISERVNEFYAWLLVLQTAMIGVFVSFDIVLFYIFFELSLIPLFFLIGVWGGPERRYAARKFFIYTFVGSALTLVGVVGIVLACYDRTGTLTFSIPQLVSLVHEQLAIADPKVQSYWRSVQYLVFVLLTAGFAVKVPLVPFHTWLPLAHVEAPTAGSVDLAGVLLKVGAYGFLRLCVPLAPDVSLAYGLPIVTTLAAFGIVYGAFCAYTQDDVKRLVAYSSISHLGLVMLGMFSLTTLGLAGSLMQMINHGLTTGGLFLLIGMIYERYHTRKLSDFGGMLARMPIFGGLFIFLCLASVGLPGLNGFVGEVLCLFGVAEFTWRFGHSPWLLVAAASGLIWGAWYTFTMMRKLLMGPIKEPDTHGATITDLVPREWLLIAPIAALCVVLGVYPQPILRTAQPDIATVALIGEQARARAGVSAHPLGSAGHGLNPTATGMKKRDSHGP